MEEGGLRRATTADLLALSPNERAEIIHGSIKKLADNSWEHGAASAGISADILGCYGRGINGPGGWWITLPVLVRLPTGDEVCPDILGWRKERLPGGPRGIPVLVTPDWICEILSPSNRRHDLVTKRQIYETSKIPWYWQVDLEVRTVTVLEWSERGYLVRLVALENDEIGLPPFEATPFQVGRWFPDTAP